MSEPGPSLLVGVDASEGARQALRWALAEGRLRRQPVVALAVWSHLEPEALTDQGFLPSFDDETAAATLHELVADEVAAFADVTVVERVTCDRPAAALVAASADADLLVVGARGLGSLRAALLGSVSDQCVRHGRCPVVVVRGDDTPRRNEIVVGVDRSEQARAALRWALDEAVRRDAVVRVVSVWHYPAVTAVGWEHAVLSMDDFSTGAADALDQAVASAEHGRDGPMPTIERLVAPGHAGEVLLEAADGAAMVVVGARGRGGFAGLLLGSTSSYCVHHGAGPVVVVR